MDTLLTVIYGIVVFTAVGCTISMEIAAHKVKVSASPSVPWMRRAVIKRMKEEVAGLNTANPLILELGSGFGSLALAAAKACPDARVIGYEISPVPLFFSRMRAFVGGLKNVKFVSGNFYEHDFSQANIVMTYLTINLMEKLRPKLEAELKTGAIVICNTFHVPGWTPTSEEMISNFVYELKVFTYRIA